MSNGHAHRERPECILSESAKPQRGRDAVARVVRLHTENALTFLNGPELSIWVKALRTYPMPVPFEKANAPVRHVI